MVLDDKTICGKLIADLTPGSEKRVRVCCDDCGVVSESIWHNYTEGQKKRNNDGKTYCRSCSIQRATLARKGRPNWAKGKTFPSRQGERAAAWKGGSYISSDGYRMIYIKNPNAKSKWDHYQKEHIILAEQILNRKLLPNEVVHHIDLNKLNNAPNNLFICANESQHQSLHIQLQAITKNLLRTGLIVFDKTFNAYVADIKLCELLETPEADNQQPSLESDLSEGSTTSENGLSETMSHHERRAKCTKFLNCKGCKNCRGF